MSNTILIDLPTDALQAYLLKRNAWAKARFFLEGLFQPPMVRAGTWHKRTVPFSEHPIYTLLQTLLDTGTDRDTQARALNTYYLARGKSANEAQEMADKKLDRYIHQYRELAKSMVQKGYVEGMGKDEIGVAIAPDGAFIKVANGNHRLAVAQLSGIERVVAEVRFVHRDWFKRTTDRSNHTGTEEAITAALTDYGARLMPHSHTR